MSVQLVRGQTVNLTAVAAGKVPAHKATLNDIRKATARMLLDHNDVRGLHMAFSVTSA